MLGRLFKLSDSDFIELSSAVTDESSIPIVTYEGLCVRFYAGVPLLAPGGEAIGGDRIPRQISLKQVEALGTLSRLVVRQLEIRRNLAELASVKQEYKHGQEALLDFVSDAIVVQDLDNKILLWNKNSEELYGWKSKEAIGKQSDELFSTEPLPQNLEIYQTVLKDGSWQGELQKTSKSGKKLIVESRWTLINDEHSQAKSIFVVDTDITQKKQLEKEFLRAQRMESIGTLAEVLNVKKNPIKIAQNMVILGEGLKYITLIVIINSFPKIVKDILKSLPKNDYPVLNSRLFFECWLSYALDNSLTSMRDLFNRLNNTGFGVDISTFSKANLHRSQKPFQEIYQKLNELVQKKVQKKLHNKYAICPIDSTIITLTSKLLWVLGHHQVKLFSSLNLSTGSPEDNFINFGHDHDYKFGSKMMSSLPINAVGVMDRGFAGLKFIQELVQESKYFVLRIKNNWKLEFDGSNGLVKVGASDDAQAYRVINFCDLETKTEFRLVTNLPESGDAAVHDDEIRDIYRLRWGVELLWKFLKMHLKLDKLITKNVNGITIQIYVSLIAYLILQLLSIPEQWGHTLLDKFRYLQSCMCQKISYVHWFEEMMFC